MTELETELGDLQREVELRQEQEQVLKEVSCHPRSCLPAMSSINCSGVDSQWQSSFLCTSIVQNSRHGIVMGASVSAMQR